MDGLIVLAQELDSMFLYVDETKMTVLCRLEFGKYLDKDVSVRGVLV